MAGCHICCVSSGLKQWSDGKTLQPPARGNLSAWARRLSHFLWTGYYVVTWKWCTLLPPPPNRLEPNWEMFWIPEKETWKLVPRTLIKLMGKVWKFPQEQYPWWFWASFHGWGLWEYPVLLVISGTVKCLSFLENPLGCWNKHWLIYWYHDWSTATNELPLELWANASDL